MAQISEINVEDRTWKLRENLEMLGSTSGCSLYTSEQFHSARGASQRAKILSNLRNGHVRTRWLQKAVGKSHAHWLRINKQKRWMTFEILELVYFPNREVSYFTLYLTNKQAYKQTVSDFNTVRYSRENPALFHTAYFIDLFDARKNREKESFPFQY